MELLKLSWFWKSKAKGGFWRSIPLIILGAFHMMAFALAGLFSSRLATTADDVLVRSPYCGTFKWPDLPFEDYNATTFDAANAAAITERTTVIWSSNYARECYTDSQTIGCDFFTKPQIESSYIQSVGCPFAEGLCLDPTDGVIRVDSGPIYSDYDLGINTRHEDAVVYRRAMTCAPIVTERFITNGTDPDLPDDQLVMYNYGRRVNETSITSDYTYSYDNYSSWEVWEPYRVT